VESGVPLTCFHPKYQFILDKKSGLFIKKTENICLIFLGTFKNYPALFSGLRHVYMYILYV